MKVVLVSFFLLFVLSCLQKTGSVLFCCSYRRQAFVCFVVPTEDRLLFVLLCLQKIGFVLFCCAYRR